MTELRLPWRHRRSGPRRHVWWAALVVLTLAVALVVTHLATRPEPTRTTACAPTVGGGAPVADPSGTVPAPRGDLPGWHQVLVQDFNRASDLSGWGRYSGQPGGNPAGWWQRDHVGVRDGALVLCGYPDGARFVTGGAMLLHHSQSYGRYDLRFRMPAATGVKYVLLLWPTDGNWPQSGEVDFAEDGGGDRSRTTATVHYGADDQIIARHLDGDFTRWHTLGVEWTPGHLRYLLDGRPWGEVSGPQVPTGSMELAVQTEAVARQGLPARVDLQVDWVAVYQRTR